MDDLIFDLAEMIKDPDDFAYVVSKLSAIYAVDMDIDLFADITESEEVVAS
jgi:hypothetical protein